MSKAHLPNVSEVKLKEPFRRALAWERAIVWISVWFAVAIFAAIYVVGNIAAELVGSKSATFSEALLWLARAFVASLVVGTVINILALLVRLAKSR